MKKAAIQGNLDGGFPFLACGEFSILIMMKTRGLRLKLAASG
jgi:hypothetical protein